MARNTPVKQVIEVGGECLITGGRLSRVQAWEQLAKEANFRTGNMASLCGVSQRQMQRYFKEHFQQTPSQWLRKLQCRIAKCLISQGYSSKATAFETRFGNGSHFCREFKKEFGATPQTFSPLYSVQNIANKQ